MVKHWSLQFWEFDMSDPQDPVCIPVERPERAAWEQPVLRRLDASDAEIAPLPVVDGITIS